MSTEQSSINLEVVYLSAFWMHFSLRIKILNIDSFHPKHNHLLGKGMHANVYKEMYDESKEVAIKCIPIKSDKTRRRVLEEWFIFKIASVL